MSKKFDTLYKKTNNGAIQYWSISVKKVATGCAIKTEYGQLNTDKPQVTIDIITKGKNFGKKNETTSEKQAELEAEAKWKKKQKTGYTTEINAATTSEIGAFVQAGIKPMLAKNFNDFKDKIKYPVILDRKYNGGRLIATKDGLFTRKGEKYISVPHIYENLKEFFDKFPDAILDGEAYNHDYRYKLNEIMRLVRKTVNITEEDLKESKEKIKYYVYDGYNFGHIKQSTKLSERRRFLKECLFGTVELVEGVKVNSEEELYKIYQEYLDDGYEGGIIRDLDSPYENKRSKFLLKIKPLEDSEGVIQDIQEGTGNWKGTGKIITLRWQDKEFNATFKGSIEEGKKFLKEKNKWIGKEITFIFNGYTGLGVPNYARVDINNCIKS